MKFLVIKWEGGHKNIAEVLSEIHDPLFKRKWWPPNQHQLRHSYTQNKTYGLGNRCSLIARLTNFQTIHRDSAICNLPNRYNQLNPEFVRNPNQS